MTTEQRVLLIKAKGGFGNRILSATTGIVIAALTDRTPVIDWRDGEYLPHGQNPYPLLFEDPVPERPEDFDQRSDVAPAIWRGRLAQQPTHVISDLFPNDHSNPFIYRRLSVDLTHPEVPEPLAVFWSYLPKMARIRRMARRAALFRGMNKTELTRWGLARHFQPNERVRQAVAATFSELERPIIGVHIRYTDRKVSLDRIFRATAKLRKQLPHALIYLATDNQRVQEQFRERFDRVVVIEKTLGDDDNSLHEHLVLDDPLREAENALIDMWSLAACDWLVHSRHSTFSVAAALIGNIPVSHQRDIDRWNPRVVVKRWIQTWA